MNETDSNRIEGPEQTRSSGYRGRMSIVLPSLIMVVTVVIAVLEVIEHRRHTAELQQRIRNENQLKMKSIQEHVEEYFSGVYSNILHISLDANIKAMNDNSRNHIQPLFDLEWERHRLSEVYIVRRDFDGTHRPFLTFEYGSETNNVEEIHTPEREEDEYRIMVEQIQLFIANPTLKVHISPEISLCTERTGGGRSRGAVYSVPIISANELVGIVAAMIPKQRIEAELSQGHSMEMAVLVNESSDMYTCEMTSDEIRSLFRQQLQQKGAANFFAESPETFGGGKRVLLSTPVNIVSEQRWWLAFLYDKQSSLQKSRFGNFSGAWGTFGGILLSGSLLALFVRGAYRRLEEKVSFLHERQRVAERLKEVNKQLRASNQHLRASEQQLQAEITERKKVEGKIKASLKEKEVLLKEIHHRVKNNMQVISSVLNLQSRQIKNKHALKMFEDSQNRIKSMALVHEKLYESEDLANIDFAEYVHSITHYLFGFHEISPCIRSNVDIKDILLDVNTAIPCGLIINELLSNSLKYAFPEGIEGEICIQLSSDKDGKVTLIVDDNGIGFPKDLDFRKTESLGMQLIIMLVEQLEGTIKLDKTKGTNFKITFEKPKPKDGEPIKWQV